MLTIEHFRKQALPQARRLRKVAFGWARTGVHMLRSIRLREKLLTGFVVMLVMAAACGLTGLIFVNHIGRSVSVLSDVTVPLLLESRALIDNAHRMRMASLDGGNADAQQERLISEIGKLDIEGDRLIARLEELTVRSGLAGRFDFV